MVLDTVDHLIQGNKPVVMVKMVLEEEDIWDLSIQGNKVALVVVVEVEVEEDI